MTLQSAVRTCNCTQRSALVASAVGVLLLAFASFLPERGHAATPSVPTRTPRQQAPLDLTGYWVSVVTEDWRFRMITAPRGDFESLFPLNEKGKEVANSWDPERDRADGAACKAYGAAGIMRMPGRLRFSWEDDYTLRLETDAGKQVRRFRFDNSEEAVAPRESLQGTSVAQWIGIAPRVVRGFRTPGEVTHLKVVTTHMSPGYLRRNGVPYSSKTTMTEYFDIASDVDAQWLTVTSIVEDPEYLTEPFVTSTDFKRQDGAEGWRPEDCRSEWGPLRVVPAASQQR